MLDEINDRILPHITQAGDYPHNLLDHEINFGFSGEAAYAKSKGRMSHVFSSACRWRVSNRFSQANQVLKRT